MATKMDPATSKALDKMAKSHAQLASGTDKQIGVLQSKVDALTKMNTALEKRLAAAEGKLKALPTVLKDIHGTAISNSLQIEKLKSSR